LAAVLHNYQERSPEFFRRIAATVRQVMPEFGEFRLRPDPLAPERIRLNWLERGYDTRFGPHQLSDGTLRFIALATLLLQPEDELPKVIVIDEPELGLHPYAIGVLASLTKAASRYCQVVIATQSVTLLDQFDASDVIVVERDPIHNATEFRRLNSDELAVWKDEYENPISLGELWERNIIGGGPH
jgi:predicted ATPase